MAESGVERGGAVRGTENMNPRLSLSIRLINRNACGNSPRPADQWRQKRQSPKKYQVISGALRKPPSKLTTEKLMYAMKVRRADAQRTLVSF